MKTQLENIKKEFELLIVTALDKKSVEEIRLKFLGKKGELTSILKGMKDLSEDERKEIGSVTNLMRDDFEKRIKEKADKIENAEISAKLDGEWIDVTWPAELPLGTIHPIAFVRRKIKSLFISMGFEVLDGPEMEDEYYNFTALNIPDDHPARDTQDTFWLSNGKLLRTHTSPVQVRGMKERKPPFRFIAPGKVFRNEAIDASHEHTFHQVEGMVVDKDISVSNLIYSMKTLLSSIFEKEVEVRLRPGFFPFVEPGFELDVKCLICGGKGCSVCKQSGWVELMPCGMVHPTVLANGGVNPEEWRGFAFGLGLERLVMMKYGINDIRHFHGSDLRFMKQF